MSRPDPRIQIDPLLYDVVSAAAAARGISKRDLVEHAVRQMILQQDSTKHLLELVQASTFFVPELFEKVDGIRDFIADRYALDLSRNNDAGA
jgi:hypothetical protein